jgi:hypothetical protein
MRKNHLPTVTMPSLRTNRRTDPANSGPFIHLQEISGSTRLRGGGCSPDRTCLHPKFPASREFSREFFEKRASEDDSRIQNAGSINRLRTNSLLNGAGNFFAQAGNFILRAGNFGILQFCAWTISASWNPGRSGDRTFAECSYEMRGIDPGPAAQPSNKSSISRSREHTLPAESSIAQR